VARGYRVLSPKSGFDDAALGAVRAWRFSAPQRPGPAETVYVYAVVGFRAPIVPTRRPPP
jgi:outer membrane biosynthesis protein TonB